MSGPVFSVANTYTKKPERYFWAVWRSKTETYEVKPYGVLDYVDPFATGRATSREAAIAAALKVSPQATEIHSRAASGHEFFASTRTRAMSLGRDFAKTIARSPVLLRCARERNARRLMQLFNIVTNSVWGFHDTEVAFAYALRLLYGEASESEAELEKFAFVDKLVEQALHVQVRR